MASVVVALVPACDVGEEFLYFHHEPPPSPPADAGADPAPTITLMFVAPLETDIGSTIVLSGSATAPERPVFLRWAAQSGSIADFKAADTTYTCKLRGTDQISLLASDGKRQAVESVDVHCR